MSAAPVITPAQLQDALGKEAGVSSWLLVDQTMINKFADVTSDHQFIHIDPVRAAQTPFRSTIAHGFLTLSLLSAMAGEVRPAIEGTIFGVNYGFDKIRFLTPVASGKRVRGRFVLTKIVPRGKDALLLHHEVTVEIEGEPRAALIAEWLTMVMLAP